MGAPPRRTNGVVARVRATVVVLLLAAGAAVLPAAPATASESDTLYALLNQARWDNGLRGLLRNAAMDKVAADWAAQMAAENKMYHNPNFSTQIPGGWTRAGENVAKGYATATSMHAGWMGSAGHRANILGNYTDVGVAFLYSGGTTWGVQVFANYPGHVGPPDPSPPPPPPPPPPPADDPPPPPSTSTDPAPAAPVSEEATDPAPGPTDPSPSAAPDPRATPPPSTAPEEREDDVRVAALDPGSERPDAAQPGGAVALGAAALGVLAVGGVAGFAIRRARP